MNAALSKADLFAMAGLRGRSTGLRNNVWIRPRHHGGCDRVARTDREVAEMSEGFDSHAVRRFS
jgi:hypothetical protein